MDAKIRTRALQLALVFAVLAACDGGGKVGEVNDSSRLQLLQVDLGRLVDVYAYQRQDVASGDRRNRANRRIELVAKNVVISSNIESQSLFSPSGEVVPTADYEFLPFDKSVGHEELLILWDNRPTWGTTPSSEVASFDSALQRAKLGLLTLAPSYRGQNTQTRPIPIVPRNAAIRMRFSAKIPVDATFFETNPSAIQLLEFKGDPAVVQPVDAFRILPYRVVTQDNDVILDTTILGGEGAAGSSTRGLPASADNVTANIRIAIPARGLVAPTFYVQQDAVPELNGPDSAARNSVIRDFRSGNLADGTSGRLSEPEGPMIVAPLAMGITAIDTANSIVTLDKRVVEVQGTIVGGSLVPIRARYPFVDGPLDAASGLPLGPLAAPVFPTLPAGDFLVQTIQVLMPNGTFEAVKLRAEILQNMEVGTVVGDQLLPRLGLAENQPPGAEQGQMISPVRVRLATLMAGKDSLGREHSFQFAPIPNPPPPPEQRGKDCTVRARYYEDIPFSTGSLAVTDKAWRHRFLRIDPQPVAPPTPGSMVQPNASVSIEFTKPMDLDQVDNTSNLLITNTHVAAESFVEQMGDPKRATMRIVTTRVSDLSGDGTVLRLQPQMGFFHQNGQTEPYCVHVRLGSAGVTDLAGNPLAIFDRPSTPQVSWSVDFRLASAAASNLVGWHTWRFENQDEDGSPNGSADLFGQFRLENGRLIGASGQRFSRSADSQNLVSISRIHRGECWDAAGDIQILPVPGPPPGVVPTAPIGQVHPGLLYWQPRMVDSIGPQPPAPQVYPYWSQGAIVPVGRVVEPHKAQGSRMQMRYLEDDFSLSYRQPSDMAIDVEQLYWSPFDDETVLYDVFDRYTMSLAHSPRRPDERWLLVTGGTPPALRCVMDCACNNSGLSETFSENILPGTSLTPVFEDKVYRINPNEAFRSEFNVKYVPFPRFDRSYTWRDSRLVTVDAAGQVIGLGGAQEPPDPSSPSTNGDVTANIDSPWITDVRDPEFTGAQWVQDVADFVSIFKHDHDPIALPLLVDFKVFPDGAANGIVAGNNGFQIAMLGAPSQGFPGLPNGYYDAVGSGCGGGYPRWPHLRVHASGGEDLVSHLPIYVDPANVLQAAPSSVKDAGLGNATHALFIAPAGDGMLNWARADFVRKVSTMTFGFFDTLQPQRSLLLNTSGTPVPDNGFPNLVGVAQVPRISDLVVQLDPPLARQPAGTSVVVEIRGVETFANSDVLYNPGAVDGDKFDLRGNLLNPNYACEAYRYSQANASSPTLGVDVPRIPATIPGGASGLTRYVTEDELNLIRTPGSNLLPRYLNLRLVMTNNVDVTPALSPSLRSMSVVYRVQASQ